MPIYKRHFKTGDKWCVYVRLPNGKRYRRVIGTKKQAEQIQKKLESEVVEGTWNIQEKEEMLFDIKNSKRISVPKFLRKYLPKVGVKLLSKINNKIVVQRDSDINLFSLKSEDDCDRFVDGISNYMMDGGRIDTIIVKDSSQHQKKYLYDLLNENGISKSKLYRRFTTYRRE